MGIENWGRPGIVVTFLGHLCLYPGVLLCQCVTKIVIDSLQVSAIQCVAIIFAAQTENTWFSFKQEE